jgi:hypothetical protein
MAEASRRAQAEQTAMSNIASRAEQAAKRTRADA